jgi:hypothetical protein
MHIISLRPRDPLEVSTEIAGQFLRLTFDENFSDQSTEYNVDPYTRFLIAKMTSLQEKTLTLLHSIKQWGKGELMKITPRGIVSFLMNFEIVDPEDIDPSGDDDQLDTLDDIPAPNENGK